MMVAEVQLPNVEAREQEVAVCGMLSRSVANRVALGRETRREQ